MTNPIVDRLAPITGLCRMAIVTKFLGPTDFRGSRVKASCEAGSVTVPWKHELDPRENHASAAYTLAAKLGWLGHGHIGKLSTLAADAAFAKSWAMGSTGSGYVFVAISGRSDVEISS